jgi:2-polyprenyl-3-methyl-5-hydroxy-6-metoxy-1,4-benzoquinol methylase
MIDNPLNRDYRGTIYSRYVSAFKAQNAGRPDYAFSDGKLLPQLEPWMRDVPRSAKCLDLGCGNGTVLHALRTLGFQHLEGVDLSEEQVAVARAEFPQVEQMDIFLKLSKAHENEYGLMTLFDVMEHLKKDEIISLLALIKSRLSHRGTLIVHCPNGESPFVGPVHYGDLTHETIITPASARHLCTLFGFTRFEAKEPRNTSHSVKGACRGITWRVLRNIIKLCHMVETGDSGSGIVSRNFIFKAQKDSRISTVAG